MKFEEPVTACDGCSDSTTVATSSSEMTYLITANVFQNVVLSLIFLLLLECLLGLVSNTLVIITFMKMGFSETINISYLALGISDIGLSIVRMLGTISTFMYVLNIKVPFDAYGIAIISYWPQQGFEKATGCLTAYIALERCLCVMFPMHVRRIVTKKIAVSVVVSIFLLTFGVSNLFCAAFSFQLGINPLTNTTEQQILEIEEMMYVREILGSYFNLFISPATIVVVWISTINLSIKLRQSTSFTGRNSNNVATSSGNAIVTKENRVIKTVRAIAITYLVCLIPNTIYTIGWLLVGVTTYTVYPRMVLIAAGLAAIFSEINSSINLFIYVSMGSKFRGSLLKLFGYHNRSTAQ